MAILVNNKYKKITSAHLDFTNDRIVIFADNYETKEDRDLEKSIQNDRYSFFYNTENYLSKKENELCEEIKAKNDGTLEVKNVEQFWKDNPELKIQADAVNEQRDEYWLLRQKLDNEEIDITSLKYLELWQSFGMTTEIIKRVKRLSNEGISTPVMEEINLPNLYTRLKEIIQADSIQDC